MKTFILGYICGIGTVYLIGTNSAEISEKLSELSRKLEEQTRKMEAAAQAADTAEPEPAQQ
jgi:hypothetical protein